MGVTVSVLPRLFEGVTDTLGLERIGGIPVISVHPTDPVGWQYAVKYAGDDRWVRLSYATDDRTLEGGLDRLLAHLAAMRTARAG